MKRPKLTPERVAGLSVVIALVDRARLDGRTQKTLWTEPLPDRERRNGRNALGYLEELVAWFEARRGGLDTPGESGTLPEPEQRPPAEVEPCSPDSGVAPSS
ncbi:MAG: hypothetical protein DYG93_11185 [Leptolyngbya sp. PLA2]|nr:hypothetical protein [Leptolyngbya sp.]MCE7972207.1 hypothetical protein [Leptolyngbya sp. PL-A2]MCQ3941215.1 hypothetical protein [cyanobacterium CYA1]MDL1905500.1 hypothetical protein [Synechococcales cyanobacterium CNB]